MQRNEITNPAEFMGTEFFVMMIIPLLILVVIFSILRAIFSLGSGSSDINGLCLNCHIEQISSNGYCLSCREYIN
jgi:hypothetical protein